MISLDFYYRVRSLIPRPIQIAVRRCVARMKRGSVAHCWPILPSAGKPPAGWRGWPDGKQFAFVLTHDVETRHGHDKCRALMDLEESMGFRSSFNLVPERYRVAPDLRTEMISRGFEVGVHGLVHDGRLFSSRKIFERRKPHINRYLKDWKAVGFRSPSTRRNLTWIGELDMKYDSSTFDTDPFEPESEGVGTIFPFIFNDSPDGHPYVELPYTLPQDSTLFIILGEDSPRIWKEKLDWIAEKGGMALINVHPDYMHFGPRKSSRLPEYSSEHYREFLSYAATKYGDQYWHVLPRCLASHSELLKQLPTRKRPLRVCLVGHSFYESDNRKLRYAKALVQRGDHVDVIGLRRPGQPRYEIVDGVHVYRIQYRQRDEASKFSFLARLLLFLLRSSAFLSRKHMTCRYDVIGVSSVPDFEVFAAWFPKLLGTKVLLDIYDISPELFKSKFGDRKKTIDWFRALLAVERAACRFADHVIAANHLWGGVLTSRSVPAGRCSVFINYLDPTIFYRHPRTRTDNKLVVIYPGNFNYHQGLDIAIRAFAQVNTRFPNAEFQIYGSGAEQAALQQLAADLRTGDRVKFKGEVSLAQVPGLMANADIGVVGKRADVFGNEAYSTKILEYMSQGLPVVAPRTKIDDYYFNDSVVCFFEPGNPDSMAAAMIKVLSNRELREQLIRNALDFVEKAEDWEQKKHEYLRIVDTLARV
jgi:glycosyltransferase involved in cell wall biosynthesis